MKAASILLLISTLILGSIIWLGGYRSAFEADQACHALMAISIGDYKESINCDHDLETRQWILYEKGVNNKAAKIIKRYRY